MPDKLAAWVTPDPYYIQTYFELLRERGFTIDPYFSVAEALPALTRTQPYDLIVLDIEIDAGERTDDLTRILADVDLDHPSRALLGIKLIECITSPESTNWRTPVAVVTHAIHPENDKHLPDAAHQCTIAGARSYTCLFGEDIDAEHICDELAALANS